MAIETEVAPGIHRVEDNYTNWYLVEDGDGLVAVDAGLPRSWESLGDLLMQLGRRHADISALILTHAHFDHIGFAERARRELGIDVWVHENDVPLTRHPRSYSSERSPLVYAATRPKALPIVAGFLRERAFWPRPIAAVRRFRSGDRIPSAPEILFTPGHTLGHVAFHYPDRDAVIAGDALVELDPYTGERGARLVARGATADVERADESLGQIAETGAATVLTGHGEPLRDAEAAVAEARKNGAF